MENASKMFEKYLEGYCKKHKITSEEAQKHRLVQDVKKYYIEEYGTRIQ